MINFKKLITIFCFSFFLFLPLLAEEKTAVIDLDLLVQNTNVGKKVLKNIKELNEINIKKLENKNKELRELENEIKNKKNVISKEDFNNEVKKFQQKAQIFAKEKNKTVKEFNDFRATEIEKLFKLFNPIISDYMKDNSINVLLDTKNTFMVNKVSNLTSDVIVIINNKIK